MSPLGSYEMDLHQHLADVLLFLRVSAGLTLDEAAYRAGVAPSLLINAESAIWTDDFRINELGAICRMYGVDALELMGWTEENLAKMIEIM